MVGERKYWSARYFTYYYIITLRKLFVAKKWLNLQFYLRIKRKIKYVRWWNTQSFVVYWERSTYTATDRSMADLHAGQLHFALDSQRFVVLVRIRHPMCERANALSVKKQLKSLLFGDNVQHQHILHISLHSVFQWKIHRTPLRITFAQRTSCFLAKYFPFGTYTGERVL